MSVGDTGAAPDGYGAETTPHHFAHEVAFVGAGAMAEAMIAGIIKQGVLPPAGIVASHPRPRRREELAARHGIHVVESNRAAAESSHIVAATVKPQVLPAVLHELRGHLRPEQLLLSVAAGVTIPVIAAAVEHYALARAMPNTPSQIGQGMTVWTATHQVSAGQRESVRRLLGSLGRELWVEEERYVAMATALSGTGPTYTLLVMEALIDAGVHMGFSRHVAEELVTQTMLGTVLFAAESGKHPAELRNLVTSPGGTSAEAIYQMEKGGLRTVLSRAVYAAYRRTVELSERA